MSTQFAVSPGSWYAWPSRSGIFFLAKTLTATKDRGSEYLVDFLASHTSLLLLCFFFTHPVLFSLFLFGLSFVSHFLTNEKKGVDVSITLCRWLDTTTTPETASPNR